MKSTLLTLLALSGSALAQTAAVTKNPSNHQIHGNLIMPFGQSLRVDGTLQTSQTPLLLGRSTPDEWGNWPAFTSILSSESGYHGLISRTQGNGGIAVLGLSETGACAGKFIQLQNFSSPAVYIGRDATSFAGWNGATPVSPSLVVATPADWSVTPIAEFRKNMTEVALSIGSDGSVIAPLQQYTDFNALITYGTAIDTFARRTGSTNGLDAPSGELGEYHQVSGATISLGTATPVTLVSRTLTAGDWDIEGIATYTKPAATVVTYTQQGISTTPNTLGATGTFTATSAGVSDAIPSAFTTPTVRLKFTTTTTVHLVCRAGFTTSTLTATGFLRARRVR